MTKYVVIKQYNYYRPNSAGYTPWLAEAGRYTFDEAVSIIQHCDAADGLSMVPEEYAPFNIAMRIQDGASNYDNKRATGRTTRMMDSALIAARLNKPVHVIFHDQYAARAAERLYPEAFKAGVTFQSPKSAEWLYDMQNMSLRPGLLGRYTVYLDHYTVEKSIEKQLREIKRFDLT